MPFSIVFLPFTATLMHQLTWNLAQIFFATCFTIYLYTSCHFEVVLWLKWVHNVYSDTKKVLYLTVFTCLWLNPLTKWLENWHRCSLAHDPQYIFMTLVILRQFWDPYELTLSIPTEKKCRFWWFFSNLWPAQCTRWLENWHSYTLAQGLQDLLMTFCVLRPLAGTFGPKTNFRGQKMADPPIFNRSLWPQIWSNLKNFWGIL